MLKKDRDEYITRLDYFMNEVAERGGVAVISTGASGVANDNSLSVATYASNPSGKAVLGVVMCDVVNKDLTKTHLNYFKEEVQLGQKVTIMTQGVVVTNMLVPGTTPLAGSGAYLGPSGLLTPTPVIAGAPLAGRFETSKDEEGYVKVSINLP